MALPGTHLRFALDVAGHYPVHTMAHYLSGTVYPDSRWITGVKRGMTHGDRFLRKDFPDSDFNCGWHVHCLCDAVQTSIYERLLPEAENSNADQGWVRLSAAKMVQDMRDVVIIDLKAHLPALDFVKAPCGEKIEAVRRFNGLVQKTYSVENGPLLEDYRQLWLSVGLSPSLAADIITATEQIMSDSSLVESIESAYDDMIERAMSLNPLFPPASPPAHVPIRRT